jgi:hypothetical protein
VETKNEIWLMYVYGTAKIKRTESGSGALEVLLAIAYVKYPRKRFFLSLEMFLVSAVHVMPRLSPRKRHTDPPDF